MRRILIVADRRDRHSHALTRGLSLARQTGAEVLAPQAMTGLAQGARTWILAQEHLRRCVAGEPLLNVVDVARGY